MLRALICRQAERLCKDSDGTPSTISRDFIESIILRLVVGVVENLTLSVDGIVRGQFTISRDLLGTILLTGIEDVPR